LRQVLLFIALTAVIVSVNWLPLAYGRPVYARDLPSSLKNYCTTCHISSSGIGGLNRFGVDYAYSGYSIDRIAGLDSDRDGYTNSQELAAGTFPGDPDSYPGSGSSGINVELIVFAFSALAAAVVVLWLRRSRL